jgi:hypothetical protein
MLTEDQKTIAMLVKAYLATRKSDNSVIRLCVNVIKDLSPEDELKFESLAGYPDIFYI